MTIDTPAAPPGTRNATLADLAALLRDQQARKADIVAPAAAIRARNGRLVIDDSAPELGPDGVTMTAGSYTPTDVCDQGIADKLGIPATYLRRMREHRPDLYDANVISSPYETVFNVHHERSYVSGWRFIRGYLLPCP